MKKVILIGSILLTFFGCSSSIEYQRMITLNEVNLWLNLMPGGPPTFHFSGQVGVEVEIVDEIELEEVHVFQRNKKLFTERPFFTRLSKQVPQFNKYLFIFGIKDGLPSHQINTDLPTDLVLVFNVNGEEVKFFIDEITIEKVY
jgi:hypothetical protein